MRKRVAFIMVTACILLITGCGDSNNTEDPTGADSQMVENAGQTDSEEKDIDVLSPLDGVTMEVTECSDTSVTVRIVNDTDKDIRCGTVFCLEMQDEESGEWRELDEVIEHADFTLEAIMIQKDSPYEAVIDFEWRYGKLEPGRYRIVKTVMDVRETGDYTDYVFTAEFGI